LQSKGGTTAHLDASMRTTSGVEIGSSPKTGIVQDSYESCGNTDSLSRGNIVFSKLLVNRLAYKYIDAITNDRYFGLYDTKGILHPTCNSTQFNWSQRGLSITCYYREPKTRGFADILVKCTSQESVQRIQGMFI
jgi:hypothetical protein